MGCSPSKADGVVPAEGLVADEKIVQNNMEKVGKPVAAQKPVAPTSKPVATEKPKPVAAEEPKPVAHEEPKPEAKPIAVEEKEEEEEVKQEEAVDVGDLKDQDDIASVVYIEDGTTLLTGSASGILRVWDRASGKCSRTLAGIADGPILSLSLQGDTIAGGIENKAIQLWSLESGKVLHVIEGNTFPVKSISLSRDGKLVVAGCYDANVCVWNVETGEKVHTFKGKKLTEAVTFSPDGSTIATGCYGGNVTSWDVASGMQLSKNQKHYFCIYGIAYSPDGKKIATASEDGSVVLSDAESGETLLTLKGHDGKVRVVSFSPNGMAVATGGDDCSVRIWDAENGTEKRNNENTHSVSVTCVVWNSSGTEVVSGGSGVRYTN